MVYFNRKFLDFVICGAFFVSFVITSVLRNCIYDKIKNDNEKNGIFSCEQVFNTFPCSEFEYSEILLNSIRIIQLFSPHMIIKILKNYIILFYKIYIIIIIIFEMFRSFIPI